MDQTINANINNCIQYTNSVGGSTYWNVCTGTHYWVPWGSIDWIVAIAVALAIIMMVGSASIFTIAALRS